MISSPFPHHTIASLRQVGMMGLTPLQENRVEILHLFRWFTHTHTTLSQLAHTQPSHTELSHPICLPPSPFSLLPFPSCLHLSFATYWKKLTCGVIPSFIASPHHPIWPICPSRTDPGTSQQWRQRVLAEGSPRGLLP